MTSTGPDRSHFPFEPQAMLPAWLVTDEKWIVRHWNNFATQLIGSLCASNVPYLTSGKVTLGEVYPRDGYVSLWACLLEPDKQQQQLAQEATRVMAEHVEILGRYRELSQQFDLQALIVELRRVQGVPGVYPYVFDRIDEEEYLRIGIRVAPRGGLTLRAAVSLADPQNSDPGTKARPMTHIEVVLGYQVHLCVDKLHSNRIGVEFRGSQPAIHDTTERSLLEKELHDLRKASNLSHALRTPLCNAAAVAYQINASGISTEECHRLSGLLLAQVAEADALVRLIHFVNSDETLPVIASEPRARWPIIDAVSIRDQIAQALTSVFYLRTDRPRDIDTVKALLDAHKITVPDDHDGDAVTHAFHQLADQTINDSIVSFSLTAALNSARYSSLEAAGLARTIALQLILPELIINAVKHTDSGNPQLRFTSLLTGTGVHWRIENTVSHPHSTSGGPLSGARREGLGSYLNQKATQLLAWTLEPVQPYGGWEAHSLVIPFQSTDIP